MFKSQEVVPVDEFYVFDRFLYLDSRARSLVPSINTYEQLTNQNNFLFKDPVQDNGFTHIAVHSVKIDNCFNNINDSNNKIKIGSTIYTVPIGYYTLANMVTAINTAIAASGVTVSISALTGCSTVSGAGSFTWTSANVNYNPYILVSMLGFTQYPLTGASSYVSQNQAHNLYTRYVDIESFALTQYTPSYLDSRLHTKNNIVRLWLDDESTSTDYENKILYKFTFEPTSNLGYIDIRLIDEWGSILQGFTGEFLLNLMLFRRATKQKRLEFLI